MLIKRKSIIVLAFACSLAFLQLAGAADTASTAPQATDGGRGRITRIQAAPSAIVIGNTEYSLPQGTAVYGPDRQPVGMDKLDVGMAIRFTIQQPSVPGDHPVISSIHILAD